MSASVATSHDEEVFWFSAVGEELLGVCTRPTVEPVGTGLVVCSGGHWVTTIGPNQMHVRMARHFAGRGFHAARFDYAGLGESTGAARPFRLDQPFSADAVAAAEWLETTQDVSDVVFLGSCFGARTALAAAHAHPNVRGVALFPPPVRDFEHGERVASLPTKELVRRTFRRSTLTSLRYRSERRRYVRIGRRRLARLGRRLRGGSSPAFEWVSQSFVGPLGKLIDKGVPVLIIYGEEDDFRADFERESDGPIPALIAKAGERLTIDVIPGRTHGLGSVVAQEGVIASLDRWLPTLTAGPTRERS